MNEQKVKNPGGWDYFDELLARRSTGGMSDAVAFLPARANASNPHAGVEFRHFLAAVYRRRWASYRRLQAPQR